MTDLFQWAAPKADCGTCRYLDPTPINPDVHYCWKRKLWTGIGPRACQQWKEGPAEVGCGHPEPCDCSPMLKAWRR